MKTKHLLCAIGAAGALLQSAYSQTITVNFVEINPNLPVSGSFSAPGNFYDIPSGLVHFQTFDGFCVEPLQALTYGETVVYDIQDPSNLGNSATIASLVGGYLASGRTAVDAAAVQWAIWEVIAEATPGARSLLDGNVMINSTGNGPDVIALANQYLANIANYTPATLTYLHSDTEQDVVTWQVIPEPASAGLVGLSALVLLRRRRG